MKKFRFMPMILGILFVVCSCAPKVIKYEDFYRISKESTQNEFNEEYGKFVDKTLSFEINGKKYDAFFTKITTFHYETKSSSSTTTTYNDYANPNKNGSLSSNKNPIYTKTIEGPTSTTSHSFNDNYIFIFYKDKYLFSGFVYELILNDNQELVKIGKELQEHIKTEYIKEKKLDIINTDYNKGKKP